MNLPSGTQIKTGIEVSNIDFVALLRELRSKLFNGYLSIAVQGIGGIEEGTVVFDNGKIVGKAGSGRFIPGDKFQRPTLRPISD